MIKYPLFSIVLLRNIPHNSINFKKFQYTQINEVSKFQYTQVIKQLSSMISKQNRIALSPYPRAIYKPFISLSFPYFALIFGRECFLGLLILLQISVIISVAHVDHSDQDLREFATDRDDGKARMDGRATVEDCGSRWTATEGLKGALNSRPTPPSGVASATRCTNRPNSVSVQHHTCHKYKIINCQTQMCEIS